MARKSPGVLRLLSIMKKLSVEVNDHEICRRLEVLMHSEKDDLPASVVKELLSEPENFDPATMQDPYVQYIRHYLYMVKRAGRDKFLAAKNSSGPRVSAPSSKAPFSSRKKKSSSKTSK